MWLIDFLKTFIGSPAILLGLFAMIGSILLKEKPQKVISSGLKTALGFFILIAGVHFLIGSLEKLTPLFKVIFNVEGVIGLNDGIAASLQDADDDIALMGALIMMVSMVLNIILAKISRFKNIYLSGHTTLYQSVLLAASFKFLGSDYSGDAGQFALVLISGSLIISLYMTLSPQLSAKATKEVSGENLAISHSGGVVYGFAQLVGRLFRKNKGKSDIEKLKLPKFLSIFNDSKIAMALVMMIVYLAVFIPAGIIYETGNVTDQEAISVLSSSNWLANAFIQGLSFTAGVMALMYGVHIAMGELVPAFRGVSEKMVKGSVPAVDCSLTYKFGSNAIIVGFLISLFVGIGMMGVTIGLNNVVPEIKVVLPSVFSHFFVGATTAILANKLGGIKALVIASIISGLIISIVPIAYMWTGVWDGYSNMTNGVIWTDPDYILYIPLLLIWKVKFGSIIVTSIIGSIWALLVIDGAFFSLRSRKTKFINE